MCREMKSCSIKWFDKIPSEWKVVKVKQLFSIGRGRVIAQTELDDDGIYPVYSSQTKNNGCLGYINTYDFDKKQLTWTTDGANAGTVFLREGKYNCTNVCGTLLPKNDENNLSYLKYILEYTAIFHKRADTNGFKIMNNEMAEITILLPNKNEQDEIANYLDKKVFKIDDIISNQKSLIEKYKDYKQSLITETVTKGLNKNIPMKKSGIEWIGEIPSHWNVCKMKNIGEAIIGLTYSPEDVSDKGTLVLRSSNVQNGEIVYRDNVFVNKKISEKLTTKVGDILICSRNGSRDLIGKCAYIDEKASGKSFGAFMTIFRSEYNRFVYYILNSDIFKFHIGTFLTSTINQLTTGNLSGITITLPPNDEQEQIVDFLNKKCTAIDFAIAKKEQIIEKLESYKKSLIYECVTGKREVK